MINLFLIDGFYYNLESLRFKQKKSMTQDQLKHLDYIQNVINRMNANSFKIKGWMVTLVSALMALYLNSKTIWLIIVAFIPLFLFWFLDAYYLLQERKFRHLYKEAVEEKIPVFSMETKYDSNAWISLMKTAFSKTILLLYGTMFMLNVFLLIFKHVSNTL